MCPRWTLCLPLFNLYLSFIPALILLVAEAPMVNQVHPPFAERGNRARRAIELDPAKTGKFSLSFWVTYLT